MFICLSIRYKCQNVSGRVDVNAIHGFMWALMTTDTGHLLSNTFMCPVQAFLAAACIRKSDMQYMGPLDMCGIMSALKYCFKSFTFWRVKMENVIVDQFERCVYFAMFAKYGSTPSLPIAFQIKGSPRSDCAPVFGCCDGSFFDTIF
jgi:hypothetical protein